MTTASGFRVVLSRPRTEVRKLHHESPGRPGMAPEAAWRLMPQGFHQRFLHDYKLIPYAPVKTVNLPSGCDKRIRGHLERLLAFRARHLG